MIWNSALPLVGATVNELEDGLGLPQFQGQDSFYFVQNGLIIQGGKLVGLPTGPSDVPFPAPFEQQILTIQLTRLDTANHVHVNSAGTTLSSMQVHITGGPADIYWFAIGA